MDPRVKTPLSGLQKKAEAEARLSSATTETTQAILQANSINSQLEKLTHSNDATRNAVADFQKRLTSLVGAPGGFFTPPSAEVTLSRVNGEVSTLYQQIWQVDAQPTSSQMAALDAAERERGDVMKRWADFKSTAMPDLNRLLRESHIPEVHVEDHPQPQIESSVDEE
jgi:chromosome segregation ATPase